ncbi:MAG: insulinase family protein [Desulfobacteraceae bacterium]|nr:MAG: insulinase family protein [Desulfobacteraceae bacterium]
MKSTPARMPQILLAAISTLFMTLFWPGPCAALPPVERFVLPNQLVVLVSEEHSLPFVTFELLIDAGAWRDPSGKGGLASLTAESILLGTRKRSASEMYEILDYMGTKLTGSCNWDYATISFRSLKKELEQGFAIFMEALTEPAFPEAEIKRRKQNTLGAIQSAKDNPMDAAQKEFRKILFANSPYDHPVEGTEESVPGLSREDVIEFHETYYRPAISILAVTGDITVEEVKEKIVPKLNRWKSGKIAEQPVVTKFPESSLRSLIDRSITQANIVLGHGGIARRNPDYYAVSVMNRILGGSSLSSRVAESVRVEKGLAYAVYTTFQAYRYPGSFQLILQTRNASAREAIELAVKEMERIKQEPVSEQELETAKRYLIGSFPLRLNTQSSLAAFLTQVEYHSLGMDYPERYPTLIRAVTREDVLRVARQYLHPDRYILVIIGNQKEIKLP